MEQDLKRLRTLLSHRSHALAVGVAIIATHAAAFAQVGPIDFKSRETKEGRNYTQQLSATLAVGKSTGQATYEFDFALPSGRGIDPTLGLSYSSSASYTEAGQGWALGVPMIERSSQHGVPTFKDEDTFQYRSGHSAVNLVATGELTSDGWKVYREETERTFARYLWNGFSWRIQHTNGLRLDLGTASTSRRGLGDRDSADNTAAWLLARIVDPHSNNAVYTYADGVGQQALLRTIVYTGNETVGVTPQHRVELEWEPFFDADDERMLSFRRGYKEVFGLDRLARVLISAPPHETANNPAKVPATSPETLTYTLQHDATGADAVTFRVSSIRVADRPPVRFAYADPWSSGTSYEPGELFDGFPSGADDVLPRALGRAETEDDDEPRTWTHVALADVTGDGLPDLVDARTRCGDNEWIVWRNHSGGFHAEVWTAPDVPSGHLRDRCALRVTERLPAAVSTFQELTDFTGDAIPDVAFWDAAMMVICRGTGHGFEPCEDFGTLPPGVTAGVFRREVPVGEVVSVTHVDLMDVNADGLVDRVSTSIGSSPPTMRVVFNDRGEGWGELRELEMPSCGFPGVISCLRLTEQIIAGDANRRMLAETRDVNGDGLPDFLTTELQTGRINVGWGTGSGFTEIQHLPSAPVALGLGHESSAGDYRALLDLIDVNGDGLPDVVTTTLADPKRLEVRFNHGGGWDPASHVYDANNPLPGSNHAAPALTSQKVTFGAFVEHAVDTTAVLVDVTGDGLADLVSARLPGSVGVGSVLVRSLPYRAPRYLVEAASVNGHVESAIDYAPLPGALPYAIHVPRAQRRSRDALYAGETAAQTEAVTEYEYTGAVYDRDEREFRGFASVVASQNGGVEVTTNYLTGKHTAGMVESEVFSNVDADGRPLTLVNEYSESTLTPGAVFVRLDRRRVLDGTLFQWRAEETIFDDYFYGRPRIVTEIGDPTTADDDVTTTTAYVVRRDSYHLLVLLASTTRSRQGYTIAYSQNYWDDRDTFGQPPTRGNLVRTRTRRAPLTSVNAHAYYDDEAGTGLGLKNRYIDPEGTIVDYAYDATYRQFPVRETSPAGTVHRSFHALGGAIAEVCGPQYLGASWRCSRTEIDMLGRPVAISVPTLSGGQFTMQLAHTVTYDDFSYPLRVVSVDRPGSPDAGTTIRYLDGFGLLAQIRTADTSNTFRVVEHGNDALGQTLWSSVARVEAGAAYAPAGDPGRAGYHMSYDHVRGSVERMSMPRDFGDSRPRPEITQVHFGRYIDTTDELGRRTRREIDHFGRVQRQRRALGTTLEAVTQFGFDGNGQLVSVTDPNGLVTSYERNLMGWVVGVVMPDGVSYEYLHNDRGQVVDETDPRGAVLSRDYDDAGRLRQIYSTDPAGTRAIDEVIEYFDSASSTAELGWIKSLTADAVQHRFRYDAGGRATELGVEYDGFSAVARARYTFDGRLDTLTYPDEWQIRYEYYRDGAPFRAIEADTGRVLGEMLLADNGQPSFVSNELGLEETYFYDARDRLRRVVSLNTQASPYPLVDDELTLSDTSEPTVMLRRGLAPGGVVRTTPDSIVLGHDALRRLRTVTRNGSPLASYVYDLGGRLTNFNELGAAYTYAYDVDKMSQRTSGSSVASYDYDDAGNVVHDQLWSAGSGGHDRQLAWDSGGRIARTIEDRHGDVAETTYHYLGGDLSLVHAESQGGASSILYLGRFGRVDVRTGELVDQVWLGSRLVAERSADAFEIPHRTTGGTVAAVTDEDGSILRQEDFLPFGRTDQQSGSADFEGTFHGMRRDQLIVAGPRAYDAAAGRWMARDPMQRDPSTFPVMNELDGYAYAYDSPFQYRDPSGLQPASAGDPYVGQELGPSQYVDWKGHVQDGDPEGGPVEVQEMQAKMEFYGAGVETVAIGLEEGLGTGIELAPFVGPLYSFAMGDYVEGGAFLALDIATVGAFTWLRGGAKGGVVVAKAVDASADAAHGAAVAAKAAPPSRTAAARALGAEGEEAAGIIKNTERIAAPSGKVKHRVPDELNHGAGRIGEVKNVEYLSLSSQLRDFIAFAQQNSYQMVLYVRETTKLSKPLQEMERQGVFTVIRSLK